MGQDGARGMSQIKREKGKTIAQDEKTSLIYGMPKVVAEQGNADYILPIQDISRKIVELL